MLIEEVSPQHSKLHMDWDDVLIPSLKKRLSFFVPNSAYTNAAINGNWNGYTCLMSRRKSDPRFPHFPTGLIPRVQRFLERHDIESEIFLKRPDVTSGTVSIPNIMDFQLDSVNEWAKSGRGLVQLPMRAGKTSYVAAGAIQKVRTAGIKGNIVFLCQSVDLLYQSAAALQKQLKTPIGIIGDGKLNLHPISVATVQTAYSAWKVEKVKTGQIKRVTINKPDLVNWLLDVEFAIYDECHHTVGNQFNFVSDRMAKSYLRLGLSGTPYSNEGEELKINAVVGEVVKRVTFEDMINHDPPLMAKPTFLVQWMPQQRLEIPEHEETPGGIYNAYYCAYIVNNELRNSKIVDFCNQASKAGESVGVLVDRIDHGELLEALIPGSIFLHGQHGAEYRSSVYEAVDSGEQKVLISTLIKEAVDIPGLNNTVFACGGKSVVKFPQSWRCLTSNLNEYLIPMKRRCNILIFRDNKAPFSGHSDSQLEMINHSGFTIIHLDRPPRKRKKPSDQ